MKTDLLEIFRISPRHLRGSRLKACARIEHQQIHPVRKRLPDFPRQVLPGSQVTDVHDMRECLGCGGVTQDRMGIG